MRFRFTNYKKEYINQGAQMMSKTWKMDKNFKGIKNRVSIYKLFFEVCYAVSEYCEFVIDENDKVVGFLMAGRTNKQFVPKLIPALFRNVVRLLKGEFGERRHAMKAGQAYEDISKKLLSERKSYDAEITLFFVDESARGHGVGKKLMNRYMEYCKKQSIHSVILLTDAGCNYGFYDYYGFRRINQVHSELFEQPHLEYNGFAYGYEVNSVNNKI